MSSKKSLWPRSKRLLPVFFSRISMVSYLNFRSFIRFQFIFLHGKVRKWSSWEKRVKVSSTKSRCLWLPRWLERERDSKQERSVRHRHLLSLIAGAEKGEHCLKKGWHPQHAYQKLLEKVCLYSWGMKSSYFSLYLSFLSQCVTHNMWHHENLLCFHVTLPPPFFFF